MLAVKALHIFFVIGWFTGFFYLPRLFVYHAETYDKISHDRFVVMERRLLFMMNMCGLLALLFGLWLMHEYAWLAYQSQLWLHLKLLLVIALILHNLYCWKICRTFAANRNTRSHKWYRMFNEIPTLLGLAVVLLVVMKPF